MSSPPPKTLASLVAGLAAVPETRGVTFADVRFTESRWSWRRLHDEAAALADALAARGVGPGDRVLLPMETSPSAVVSLLALLRAGVVPATVPGAHLGQDEERRRSELDRLAESHALAGQLEPAAGVAGSAQLTEAPAAGGVPRWRYAVGRSPSAPRSPAAPATPATPAAEDLALVQFSSGTTRQPKGVELSHAAVLANLALCRQADARGPDAVHVSWLPLYHDMGLVGSFLASLHSGHDLVLLDPACFVLKPVSWLEALSRHRATSTAAPNFALAVCCERIPEAQLRRRNLDLSRLRSVFDGAEPVRPWTVRRFEERLREHGLRPGTVRPVYGLAEATLIVTAPEPGESLRVREVDGLEVPSVGRPLGDLEVRIVEPRARGFEPLPRGSVGEIVVRGSSLASGYHRDAAATAEAFVDGWLRTGDLGLLDDSGRLHVTGRLKDLLFVAGRNYYAHEIGDVVDELPFVRRGHSHAVAVPRSAGDDEIVVLLAPARGVARTLRSAAAGAADRVCRLGTPGRRLGNALVGAAHAAARLIGPERSPQRLARLAPRLGTEVRRHLQRELGLAVDRVELVPRLPKTTSGKVLREACHRLALERRPAVR